MLAMDVVDTLRHRQELVERELDETERAADLQGRLKGLYAAQGIDVPDEVIAEGIAALAAERFVYHPAPPSPATTWARIYVTRNRWGGVLLAALAVSVVAWGAYHDRVVAPRNALPGELAAARDAVAAIANDAAGADRVAALYAAARAALDRDDTTTATARLRDLDELRATLEGSYRVRIVNRPGEASGVWRVPEVNPNARNYYLIVEAIGPDGKVVPVTVHDEETGADETVARWGLRVDEAAYQRVARDKQDDGIIQDDVVGTKARGALEPAYTLPTTRAAITRW